MSMALTTLRRSKWIRNDAAVRDLANYDDVIMTFDHATIAMALRDGL